MYTDPERAADWGQHLACLGFKHAGPAQAGDWQGQVLCYGRIRITVAGVRPGTAAASQVAGYGDSVGDVALFVDDVCTAFNSAIAAGAAPVMPPTAWLLSRPSLLMAAAGGPGLMRHTLYHARPHVLGSDRPGLPDLPGIACVALRAASETAAAEAADFYRRAFGFSRAGQRDGRDLLRSGDAAFTFAADASGHAETAVQHLELSLPGSPHRVDLST